MSSSDLNKDILSLQDGYYSVESWGRADPQTRDHSWRVSWQQRVAHVRVGGNIMGQGWGSQMTK